MDLWARVQTLAGQELATIGPRPRRFQVLAVRETSVLVRPHDSYAERYVPRRYLEAAARLELHGEALTFTAIARHMPGGAGAGYVAAILRALEESDP